MVRSTSLCLMLMAASLSDAYLQIIIRDPAGSLSHSPLDGFALSLPPNGPDKSNPTHLAAVRYSKANEVDEKSFWLATWAVHHNPGASAGVCKDFPCNKKVSTGKSSCGPLGCFTKKEHKHKHAGGKDYTLYNMAKGNPTTMMKNDPKKDPQSLDWLRHLYFLGHAENPKSDKDRFWGSFKPHDALSAATSVIKLWKDVPRWEFVTFDNADDISAEVQRMTNNKHKKVPNWFANKEHKLEIPGTLGQTLHVCYIDELGDWRAVANKAISFHAGNPTWTASPNGLTCDPVELRARVLLPGQGTFKDMHDAAEGKFDFTRSTAQPGLRLVEPKLDEDMTESEKQRVIEKAAQLPLEEEGWVSTGQVHVVVDKERVTEVEKVKHWQDEKGDGVEMFRGFRESDSEESLANRRLAIKKLPVVHQGATAMTGMTMQQWDAAMVEHQDGHTIKFEECKKNGGRNCHYV